MVPNLLDHIEECPSIASTWIWLGSNWSKLWGNGSGRWWWWPLQQYKWQSGHCSTTTFQRCHYELVQLEVTKDDDVDKDDEEDEDDSDSDKGGDQTDEDEDEEGEDDYGYVWNIVSGSLGGQKYSIIVFI